MPESKQLPKLLSAKDVADWLGISEQALSQDRYRSEGIPFVKFGKRVRYRLDDLIAYVERNTNATS